ncbi:dirigent protein 1-like [Lolium perenne]|uniref:dirigent protein 1-like n=1 Tax=Lolium perenne TaxID=4522 RepID=UPI0021EB0797|nr:dirigent protein 1-like [Lolium perenne]
MSTKHTMQLLPVAVSMAILLVGAAAATKTTTHLKFYMHDIVTAVPPSPATAVRVARAVTQLPPLEPAFRFGDVFVIDDLLTEGPDAASPAVGTAQGYYMYASRTDAALMLSVNMVFTAGPHNGSTIAVLGRDAILDPVRELPVVGGTGMFRGATGYGLLRTYSINGTTFNAVLQVDMYVHARV